MLSFFKNLFVRVEEDVDTIVGDFHSLVTRLENAGARAAQKVVKAEEDIKAATEARAKALAEGFRATTIARNLAGLFHVDAPAQTPEAK